MLRGNYLSLYCCCEFFLVEKNLTFDLLCTTRMLGMSFYQTVLYIFKIDDVTNTTPVPYVVSSTKSLIRKIKTRVIMSAPRLLSYIARYFCVNSKT